MKFIFATTEPQKLPETILSRCQRHDFRRIPAARMLQRLKEICQAEGAGISDRSLSLVVRQSEGGMRDALSLLDQILSACGVSPTDEEVAEALGAIDRTLVQEFAEALVLRDAKKVLGRVEEVFNRGADLKRLAEEISLQIRHVFVAKATGEAPAELADSEQQAVLALGKSADAAQLARIFDVLQACVTEIGKASQPRLALEMSLLKAIQLAPSSSIPELVAKVERLAQAQPGAAKTTSPAGAPGGRSGPTPFRA